MQLSIDTSPDSTCASLQETCVAVLDTEPSLKVTKPFQR